MRPIARLFVSCLLLLSLPLSAETLSGLYQVREVVSSLCRSFFGWVCYIKDSYQGLMDAR
mgnify:CR=1 FL=1